jgi:hypothetical protein
MNSEIIKQEVRPTVRPKRLIAEETLFFHRLRMVTFKLLMIMTEAVSCNGYLSIKTCEPA